MSATDEESIRKALGPHKTSFDQLTVEQRQEVQSPMEYPYEGAPIVLQALHYYNQLLAAGNTPQLGSPCPTEREGAVCKTIEFDNIKVFYHPSYPEDYNVPASHVRLWNYYIARPGAQPSECIDWEAEGIKVSARMPDGMYGESRLLTVGPGAQVRIEYPIGQERRTHEIVFPNTPFPTHYIT